MEDDPVLQLVPEERFEEGEDHVKDVGLIYDVDVLDPEWETILKEHKV